MNLSSSDWTYVNERAQHFTGRAWVFERIGNFLASDARMLVIVAPPGTGKTAIAARLAQASEGRSKEDPAAPVPAATIAAAVFCRAGRVSLLEVAQNIADQLSTVLDGFEAEQRLSIAPNVNITGPVDTQVAGDVQAGARVAGVNIDLARLGPERAFADGLALPLRRLNDKPGFLPPVLLVDSLDEAYASAAAQSLPRELAALIGVRLVLTTRDDPRVLAELGDLDGAVTAGQAVVVNLIDDAPAGVDDVAGYATGRLDGHGPDEAVVVLAGRIGEAARGNFLYAYHVVAGLLSSSALADLDATAAAALPLPAGGLAGVYGDFLRRDLGRDLGRWRALVRPILGPVVVALGEGLDTTQLAAVGSVLAGARLSVSNARDVVLDAGQFLEGPQPDGPFRVYHRSFAEFLLDVKENPDWPVDAGETHAAIVEALTPGDAAGGVVWNGVGRYVRTHLADHAAACGRLDELLTDLGFLVIADVDRLLPLLWTAEAVEAREAAAVVQLASGNLRGRSVDERGSYLELAARMRGVDALADRIATLLPDRPWSVPCARWQTPTIHVPLRGHQGSVEGVAVGAVDGRPVAISGGEDGTVRVWDLRTLAPLGRPLTGHEGVVLSIAVGEVDARPVAISGGIDGTVRVWDLRTLAPLSTPLHGHEGQVHSVDIGSVDDRPVAVSAGDDSTVRVWDLRTLTPLGEPLRGHTGWVRSVVIGAADGRPLAVSAGDDGTIRVWDLRTLAPLGEPLRSGTDSVFSVAVGAFDDQPLAVSGDSDGAVRAWDLRTLAPIGVPLTGHVGLIDWVNSVAIAVVDGRPLAVSGSNDGSVRLLDLPSLAPLGEPLTGYAGAVNSVAIGEVDGRPVAVSGGQDGTIRVWDLRTLASLSEPLIPSAGTVHSVAVGAVDGRPVAVSGGDSGTIRMWDLGALAALGEFLTSPEGTVDSVALGVVDGKPVAITGGWDDHTVRVWDLRTLAPIGQPLAGHEGVVHSVAIGEVDARPVAISAGIDGSVRVWDLRTYTPVGEPLTGHEGEVRSVAIGAVDDRPVAVSAGMDGTVRIWDLRTLASVGEPLHRHNGPVGAVVIGAVDHRPVAVSAGVDGSVRTWDLRTLAPLGVPLLGHTGPVGAVAIGEVDGRPVAITGGDDETVRVWDVRSWSQAALVSVPSITGLAVAGSNRAVVAASAGLLFIQIDRLATPSMRAAADG